MVPEPYWTAGLITTVPSSDSQTIAYLNKSICGMNWTDAKPLLIKHFSSLELIRHYNQQYSSIRCAPDESISHFSCRFLNLVTKTKKNPDCLTTRDAFLAALPTSLQSQLKIKAVELESLSELISFAIRFESLEESLAFYSGRQQNKLSDEMHCNYCRKSGHVLANCPKKIVKETDSERAPPKMDFSSRQNLNPVVCFKCGAPGHISPKCPLNHPGSVVPSAANKSNKSNNLPACNSPSCSASTSKPDARTFIQILLNGQSFDALVDTGSELSFLSKETFYLLFKNPPLPTAVRCSGFFANSVRSPLGISSMINIQIGNIYIKSQLLVETLSANIPVILGVDLLSQCGIALTNLPVASPEPSSELEIDPIDNVSPEVLQEPLSLDQQSQICAAIKPLLDLNSKTAQSFCSHPHSLVSLPTGTATPCYVKQYRIPYNLRGVVAETVQTWKEKGIVVEAPVGCSWNSPLLVVSKKDLEGKPTKHRICLDPRPINDLLPDDRFPIPLINEMLERTSGSSIFSSIDLVNSYHQFPLNPDDCQKTSFSALGRQFMFVGAPFWHQDSHKYFPASHAFFVH